MASNAVLPPPMITYPAAGCSSAVELADRDAADPVGHVERRRIGRRNTRRHVGRVDDAASHRHVRHLTGHPGAEAPVAEVVAHREEAHPARRQEAVTHDLVEVAADLRAAGSLVEAGVRAVGLDPVLSERGRVDAVVPRRLVQLHERVRVEPVTAGSMAPLDHHDVGVAVLDQRVDERHPERAGTDDEIVGLELRAPGGLEFRHELPMECSSICSILRRAASRFAGSHSDGHKPSAGL